MSINLVILATINPKNKDSAAEYSEKSKPLIWKEGVKSINRLALAETVRGDSLPSLVMIVEFPATENIHRFIGSDEYKSLVSLRESGFTNMQMAITN